MTTKRFLAIGAMVAVIATTACDGLNQAMTSHKGVVARAAGLELSVDQAAELIGQNDRLAADNEVVEAVANLWVDYVLLADAAVRDSTLAAVNVSPIVDPIIEQQIFTRFNEEVIRPDTTLSDEELLAIYQQEQPGAQIRARHILLRVTPDAEQADRDNLLANAQELRAKAVAGTDFAKLAEEHSEDPGSARRGGDLGFFGRGQMVEPFDQAAFALAVGEISEVVETPFGYHIIKLEERKGPTLDEIEDSFREQARASKMMRATQDYIEQLTASYEIEVKDGAYDLARELASKPSTTLSGRAASRVLVEYKGGSFTTREYLAFIHARTNHSTRAQLAEADDSDLERVLTAMTHNEIIMDSARKEGITVPDAERDSIANGIRSQLAQALEDTGLSATGTEEGESQRDALERRVNTFIGAIIRGEQDLLELGPISFALRDGRAGEIFERTFPEVVRKLQQRKDTPEPDNAPGTNEVEAPE